MTELQINKLVWDKKNKRQGKLISFSRDMGKSAAVEFIVNQNKETGECTTKVERIDVKNLVPYRKPKPRKYNPDEMYWMVHGFQKAFGHPAPDKPTMLTKERIEKRNSWMLEECSELLEADTLEDQVDAAIDKLYFAIGDLVELGVRPYNIFKIVNEANMGKLHNGKPVYKEDGKVKKPDNWEELYAPEPKIKAEIERQLRVNRR
ncbi:hypothetical protein [Halalkalibacter oceani]|uniref:hypothetical protein n=1 Tax=Halalkalibacter oceani TaxID=1653776 RepID=UPI00347BE21C